MAKANGPFYADPRWGCVWNDSGCGRVNQTPRNRMCAKAVSHGSRSYGSKRFVESRLLSTRDWMERQIHRDGGKRRAYVAKFEMQIDDRTAAAEICQFRGEQFGIPSVWLIHLPVDDLLESLRRVGEGGGEVVREFAEQRYAVVRDPVGVYLALQSG